ncbi:MAG: hypothetical protein ACQEV0_14880 [Bacillota bacterium]
MGESQQPFIWIPFFQQNNIPDYSVLDNYVDGSQEGSGPKAQGEKKSDGRSKPPGIKDNYKPISRENLEELIRGFEGYEVETIELNVVGGIETSGPLQFIIAGKAEAGMTVVLKKKVRTDEKDK